MKKKGENKMGMVRDSEDMQREVNEMLEQAQKPPLISTQINATTELSVYIRPLCYDVMLNNKNIVSCNCPENAIAIYYAMRADFRGEVYNG